MEVIELTDGSEDSKCSQKSRKPLEKQGVIKNDTDEEKMQDAKREFQEHSQTSRMNPCIEITEH